MKTYPLFAMVIACTFGPGFSVLAENPVAIKTESFDRDPKWESFNSRVPPKILTTVQQDFGYRTSNFAGKEKGEIGGHIWRSSTRASYAAPISPKTLAEKLSASGTFAITATSGSSGVFFGWFNSDRTAGGRQSTLGFRFAGEGSGSRITLQLVTGKNQACGTKVTPWIVDKTKPKGEGRKFRPTSIKNDGTRYTWKLDYDPEANNGDGQIQFAIRSDASTHEEFENKTFSVNLPKGYKEHGTTFDRFGLMNAERGGNSMTIYFDDLQFEGKTENLAKDPGWIGSGNHVSFEDRNRGGAHDFGFSPQTAHAGGKPGEMGGMIWRSGLYAYYANPVGPLTLNDRLEAGGKVLLDAAPPDSGMYIGWFNSAEKTNAPPQSGNFLGIKIGGPTRVGHYFAPAYATASENKPVRNSEREHPKRISIERKDGPVLVPQKVFDWKIVYDPSANDGKGSIETTLGDETVTFALKDGDKAKGAMFDRFGLFTGHLGGSFVKIYFDDLKYTVASAGR